MYNLSIPSDKVHSILGKYILTDGIDITLDLNRSFGSYVFDSKRNRTILDLFTCFASLPLGYNHPSMLSDESFKRSLLNAALINPSNSDIYTQEYAEFVQTFAQTAMPSYFHHAFFISGGTLAVENTLKAAMDWKVQKNSQKKGYKTEKGHQVIHFEQAFHGRSGYTLSLTNAEAVKTKWYAKFDWPRIINPKLNFPITEEELKRVEQVETAAVAQIKQAFIDNPDDICAIIIEPVQGEGGDNHFRPAFFEKLRVLCDENEALLIYDEVQTGGGLTGKFWAHEHFGENARPDMIAFGKKLQVCGVLAGKRIDEVESNVFAVPSRINSTWGGNLADMVRATKILQIIKEDNILKKAEIVGEYFYLRLLEFEYKSHLISNVRGLGLMLAMDLPSREQRNSLIKKALDNDLMLLGCGERSIRFRPLLTIDIREIDEAIEKITKCLNEI